MFKMKEKQGASQQVDGQWRTLLFRLVFFCGASVYIELCLHLVVFRRFDIHIIYPILFGLMTGAVTTGLTSLLPRIPQRIVAVLLILLQCLTAEVQMIYHAVFGNLMPILQVGMGGGVLGGFMDQTLFAIRQNIWRILLLLVPFFGLIAVMLCKGLRSRIPWKRTLIGPGVAILLFCLSSLLMRYVCHHRTTAWRLFNDSETTTDASYQNVGMTATTLQELRYLILGSQKRDTLSVSANLKGTGNYDPKEWNVIPGLDFAELASQTDDPELQNLDEYIAGMEPTRKNEYTGLLKNYNVIEICAESYSPWIISEEMTPTLWRMSQNGIIFDNYYGTFNSMTTNGEYALCLGLLPDMTRTKTQSSFDESVGHYLPFCLGTILKDYGYSTLAYHANNGAFYNRLSTHPNMGYIFKAQGSGLNVTSQKPASDLEMMEQSVDDYLDSDQPFHAYYMSYSGHYQYDWDNAMSAKHRQDVSGLPYSEEVKAYVACNLELDAALAYLERRLSEAGKLDNTVIIMTNDHYPYGLSESQYNELAGREIDTNFEKYRNQLLCYAPGIGRTIHVDEYCCTIDVLPTLLNLLGVEYDSRLLAGRDILSDSKHAAILQDGSFLTKQFRYSDADETFESNGLEEEADESTREEWRSWAEERFVFSRMILNTDYYAHVFPGEHHVVDDEIPFDDDEISVRSQGNILFLYRKGLIDLYTDRLFAPEEDARVGDYVTAIYRYLEKPQTSDAFLPAHYLTEDPEAEAAFRSGPQFDAVCWAFEKGILREDDRLADYRSSIDNVEICLLLYRTVEYLRIGDMDVDPERIEAFEADNDWIREDEIQAAVWAVQHGRIHGNPGQFETLFNDSPENTVTRYRLVLFLIKLLYPEITT